MRSRPSITLGQVLVLSLLGLALLLGLLFHQLLEGSRASILQSAEKRRDEASRAIADQVKSYLGQAESALERVEVQIQRGALRADDMAALETGLYSQLLANDNLAELTLTYGRMLGHDDDGDIRVAAGGRGQLSVYRIVEDGSPRIFTRHVHSLGGRYVSECRKRPAAGGLLSAALAREVDVSPEDPTSHLTFRTPARRFFYGRPLWSDLALTQLDAYLPEPEQRVVVTVQKTIEDASGAFVGVLRAGLLAEQLNEVGQVLKRRDPSDQHRVFICDKQGRLITRIMPSDRLDTGGEDLRVESTHLPPDIVLALRQPAMQEVASLMRPASDPEVLRAGEVRRSGRFNADGQDYLVTFTGLGGFQDWIVGIVVPEAFYLGSLVETRRQLLQTSLAVMAFILAGGVLTLRAVRRGLRRIVDETRRMERFEFAPAPSKSPFRDVSAVLESLEQAKTAVRAMGKYVPIGLVRQLYERKSEPVLGGEVLEVSMMFTDIRDFTALAERLSTNTLATALGHYLEVMTAAIHETGGTIDKYIGDAVMALWNTPTPVARHAEQACRAALRCIEAARSLYASPAWEGLPPLETRFGLHRDSVMVGHFGAPDRMNFTAMGDGVNLASRLEGLNKQYGTSILLSEAIRDAAGEGFEFRLLDLVAVKGKKTGVKVYELLGAKGGADNRLTQTRTYEQAFDAYARRDFTGALSLLERQPEDPPSRVLAERCRQFLLTPPPPDWDGIYVSTTK